MKYIPKSSEPRSFLEWKALANEDWQPSYGNFSGNIKREVKQILMMDQGFICCYCEQRIDGSNSHIEHLRPRSRYPERQLDFENLLCSCQNRLAKKEPLHCGSTRGDWFDEKLLISPLDPQCETKFSYTMDGNIGPANENDLAAKETITRLGLGIPKLVDLRKAAIFAVIDQDLSDEEFLRLVSNYQDRDSEGKFGEFCSAIGYLFPI